MLFLMSGVPPPPLTIQSELASFLAKQRSAQQSRAVVAVLSHTKYYESIFLHKALSTQLRQLVVYISNSPGLVDGFVGI